MQKSPTQEKLEAQRNQDIRDVVVGAFRKFEGRRNMLVLVAADLEVTGTTLYRWCSDLGIDIDLDAAIEAKLEHNKTRPYRHGGKAL